MSSLNAFLNPIQIENKEVVVSNRFVEDGKPVPFVIRPISQEENKKLIKKFTTQDKKKGTQSFDRAEYIAQLSADAVVFPDLTNAELQKAFEVLGASNLLQKMLYAGEYAELVGAVQELSGFDEDINDDIEEVKRLRQGDPEFNLAHFALQKLRILPSTLDKMDDKEKAFVFGSILIRVENEKKESSKIKHSTPSNGRRSRKR